MRTEAEGRVWSLSPKPKAERDGIRTYIPPVGTAGDLFHHRAERVGILSAAYKSPRAAEVALTAGINKSGDRSVKVQGLCI